MGAWVRRQRLEWRCGRHSPAFKERIKLLENIGFKFQVRQPITLKGERLKGERNFSFDPSTDDWRYWYNELKAYKTVHGNCNVPRRFKENPFLGEFVYMLRRRIISANAKDQLDKIGFTWKLWNLMGWHQRYEQLKEYKAVYGHCNVPRSYTENPQLVRWVLKQRRVKKTGELKEDQEALLEQIGFEWYRGYKKLKHTKSIQSSTPHQEQLSESDADTDQQRKIDISESRNTTKKKKGLFYEWQRRKTKPKHAGTIQSGTPHQEQSSETNADTDLQSVRNSEQALHKSKLKTSTGDIVNQPKEFDECNEETILKLHEDEKEVYHAAAVAQQPMGKSSIKRQLDHDEKEEDNLFVHFVQNHHRQKQPRKYSKVAVDAAASAGLAAKSTATDDAIKLKQNRYGGPKAWYIQKWHQRYNELKAYKKKYGNCDVPRRDKENPRLSTWVSTQRVAWNRGSISDERIELLKQIGFKFQVHRIFSEPNFSYDPSTYNWLHWYNKLKAYKTVHGNCNVPRYFKDDELLGAWVYFLRQREETEGLSANAKDQLARIGFTCKLYNKVGWHQRYNELKEYKAAYGHCNVPKKYEDNIQLGNWVQRQRLLKKFEELKVDRQELLEQIGFMWRGRKTKPKHAETIQPKTSHQEQLSESNADTDLQSVRHSEQEGHKPKLKASTGDIVNQPKEFDECNEDTILNRREDKREVRHADVVAEQPMGERSKTSQLEHDEKEEEKLFVHFVQNHHHQKQSRKKAKSADAAASAGLAAKSITTNDLVKLKQSTYYSDATAHHSQSEAGDVGVDETDMESQSQSILGLQEENKRLNEKLIEEQQKHDVAVLQLYKSLNESKTNYQHLSAEMDQLKQRISGLEALATTRPPPTLLPFIHPF